MTVVATRKDIDEVTNDLLSFPAGIYVDRNTSSFYVADSANNRIQKWLKDAKEGITVAGPELNNLSDTEISLGSPENVLVDVETNVVCCSDTLDNRIG